MYVCVEIRELSLSANRDRSKHPCLSLFPSRYKPAVGSLSFDFSRAASPSIVRAVRELSKRVVAGARSGARGRSSCSSRLGRQERRGVFVPPLSCFCGLVVRLGSECLRPPSAWEQRRDPEVRCGGSPTAEFHAAARFACVCARVRDRRCRLGSRCSCLRSRVTSFVVARKGRVSMLYPPGHPTAPTSLTGGCGQQQLACCPVCLRADCSSRRQYSRAARCHTGYASDYARHLPCDLSHVERVDCA